MKRTSIMTLLALFAATLTQQGAAWAQDTKDDDWMQEKTRTSEWTHLTKGSTSGFQLRDNYYYVTEDLTFTNTIDGDGKGSGMNVQADRKVTLYIPKGVTLTAIGADGQGRKGGGAGILVPSGTTLNIIGEGKIVARGGKAANGGDGGKGGNGQLIAKDGWTFAAQMVCGKGGKGGDGGGGAGAGIGTVGGNGGAGGDLSSSPSESESSWEGGDLAGVAGKYGSTGDNGAEMGEINIQSSITRDINGGAAGDGGAAGYPGNVAYTGGEIEIDYMMAITGIEIPTTGSTNIQAVAGGGGGGGGAGGGSAQKIGTGGPGGGGGASGAHGSGCAKSSWADSDWYSVGAGGGNGGSGMEENGGDGYTCWFEDDNNIFDDEDNHKPGGLGGAPGSESESKSYRTPTTPSYTVKYYAIPVTPSKANDSYSFGSSTTITLPGMSSDSYKWMLSVYGNAAGNTTSQCAGPNGTIYEQSAEVDLSNIYGNIEFTAVEVGLEIDCANSSATYSGVSATQGKYTAVNLKDRTLYKDGYWNTLTLPFSLSADKLATTCLAGADIRTFQSATYSAGTLTITFSDSNDRKIVAGKPCIIRWTGEDIGDPIKNPSFTNVSVDIKNQSEVDSHETSSNGLTFEAQLAPVQVNSGDKALLLGGENKLYKPGVNSVWVLPTRAYFTYSDAISLARELVLDFGGDEDPVVTTIDNVTMDGNLHAIDLDGIFNLNGQRLSAPHKGINIINGKKVVIK